MSIPVEDGCYCKECNAPVDQTDERCPNGHILKDVGKQFIVSLDERIAVSAEVKTELTKAEKTFLQKIGISIRKSMKSIKVDTVTIKLPFIDITFEERSQDAK